MTTEADCETMEAMLAAVDAGEVRNDQDWIDLCARLGATEGHRFVVTLMRGRPWRKKEPRP